MIKKTFAALKLTGHIHKDEGFDSPCFRLWEKALERLDDSMIDRGKTKLLTWDGYMKNPATFVALCQSNLEDFGLPDSETAFNNACNFTTPIREYPFLHPAVYHAAADTGIPQIRLGKGKNEFKHHYKQRCNQVMSGIELKIPQQHAIEHQKGKPASKDEIRKHIDGLKALLS